MSDVRALQDALATEHALLFSYGVLGARTSAARTPDLLARLSECYAEHRSRRDTLRGFILDAGAEPVAADALYDIPAEWSRPGSQAPAAVALEASACEAMSALVAASDTAHRQWALQSLVWSATRQVLLGAEPEAWPGAPELDG